MGPGSIRSSSYAVEARILVSDVTDYYRNARPNRYPMPKKTRITTATINATSPIMVRNRG